MGTGARRGARESGASVVEFAVLLGLVAGLVTAGASIVGKEAERVLRCTGIVVCVKGVTIERTSLAASPCLTGAGRDRCRGDLRRLGAAARKAGLIPNAVHSARGGMALTRR